MKEEGKRSEKSHICKEEVHSISENSVDTPWSHAHNNVVAERLRLPLHLQRSLLMLDHEFHLLSMRHT